MMYPILCKVRYENLHQVLRKRAVWIQIAFSIVMNWLVAPFLMVSSVFNPVGISLTTRVSSV